ncbi:hypothetical protein COCCADRAFT_60601, partial [Bipolaris zeicola 26-R-13]
PLAVRLRGPLQVDALAAALLALEQRHEMLRTTFEEQDGTGMQIVQPSRAKDLRIIDVSDKQDGAYNQILQHEQTMTFDLTSEPGLRACLLKLGENDHILSIVMHHIISDGWSVDVLCQELSKFYAAGLRGHDPLSYVRPLLVQYRDFAVWQKQADQAAEHDRQLKYWAMQLKDSSPAEMITDFPRPAILSGEASVFPIAIEGSLYNKLREFCRVRHVTPFTVLLATFRAAHYRLTGAEDATIGTPIANRNRPELEDLIGFFVNTQCMRITIDDSDTFEELVRQVRSTTAAAFVHQDVPFERIVSALLPGSNDTSRNPLVQLMFALHSQQDLGKIQLEGLVTESVPIAVSTRFDVEFHLFQEVGRLSGMVISAKDLFEPETIHGMIGVFHEILRRGLEQPQTPIATMPLTDGLVDLRNKGLLEVERTDYPRESSVVDVFYEQVAAHPDAIAVTDAASQLTYSELDQQSNKLANWLRQRCLAAETLVGVLAPRSCQAIVAFIGILKANLAYLPLDVNVPAARIDAILSEVSGHRLVLLGSSVHPPDVQASSVEMVRIDDTLNQHDPDAAKDTLERPQATSLAYVIFTSGSTGKPKG